MMDSLQVSAMGDTEMKNMTPEHEPCSHRIAVTVNKEYNVSRDKLMIYFGKSINGGHDMVSLIYPYEYRGRNVAVVEYKERKWVELLIERQAQIKIKAVNISLEVTIFEEILGHGSMDINRVVYKNLKSHFTDDEWGEMMHDISEEYDVIIDEEKCSMTGDFYKIWSAKKMLDDLASKHLRHEQNNPQDIGKDESSSLSSVVEIPHSTQYQSKDECQASAVSERESTRPQVKSDLLPVDDSRKQRQEELRTEANVSVTVDCHTLDYIKFTDEKILLTLMEDYGIEWVGEADGRFSARFLESDKIVEAKEKLEEFFKTAESGCIRKTCQVIDRDENIINHGIETVRKKYCNVYVKEMSRETDGTMIFVFISSNKGDCDEAVRIFCQTLWPAQSEGNCGNEIGRPENSHELRCYPFPNENLQLRVLQGNIVDQKVEAIVNAANADLHDGGGVTGAIFSAGGPEFRKRCQDVMKERSHKPLGHGEVVITEACGTLNCESVLHAVAPKYRECANERDCQQRMNSLCLQIFMAADQLKFQTISMPAMGTGIYGVPVHVFCDAMISSIKELRGEIAKGKVQYLKEIRLVNFNKYQAEDIAWYMSSKIVEGDS